MPIRSPLHWIHRLLRRGSPARDRSSEYSDPMEHPSLARMSERELADLPFARCCADG